MRLRNQWFIVSLFAIAMGLLECIVVVYLRELYYPDGFAFPLKSLKPGIISAEILREAATLIMLLSVGMIAGRSKTEKFAWFIYSFAVWDIFYYIFLKLLLGWPASMLTWDILFLLPFTWVGPVIGPLINSVSMIALAFIIITPPRENNSTKLKAFEWFLLITGSVIVIVAYTKEYVGFMLNEFSLFELLNPNSSRNLIEHATSFIPSRFDWGIFISGVLLHWLVIILIYLRKWDRN